MTLKTYKVDLDVYPLKPRASSSSRPEDRDARRGNNNSRAASPAKRPSGRKAAAPRAEAKRGSGKQERQREKAAGRGTMAGSSSSGSDSDCSTSAWSEDEGGGVWVDPRWARLATPTLLYSVCVLMF